MRITIDTEMIKNIKNLSEEEIAKKPLNELLILQDDCHRILHEQEVQERLLDDEYKTFCNNLLKCKDILLEWFSFDEIVNACAKTMSKRDLAEEFVDRNCQDSLPWRKNAILKCRENRRVKRLHGPGSRSGATDVVRCSIFYVPNQYQHLKYDAMMQELLKFYNPSLEKYDIKFYTIDKRDSWIFVTINDISLYVPMFALFTADENIIRETHMSYHSNYYRDKPEIVQKHQEFINSKEVKNFFNDLCNAKIFR